MTEQDDSGNPRKYGVGYCNPPKHSRFKKGQSGNPKGRPKGSLNLATALERTLREPVDIVENGRRRRVTKLEAAVKQLTNKAATGELKALQLLSSLVRTVDNYNSPTTTLSNDLSEADEQVVLNILKRMKSAEKG